jgi:hypothetical protein
VDRRVVLVLVVIACGDNLVPSTQIVGQVFEDVNGNGIRDEGEAPVAAVVFVNLDQDPSIGSHEPRTRTAADGTYALTVDGPGTYDLRIVPPFGWRATPTARMKPGTGPAAIVGGNDANAGDYGFMVSLAAKYRGFAYPTCGGALISDRHIVTAAHCSTGALPNEVAIIAGALDPFDNDALVLDVASVVTHPSYNYDATHGFDIAVWTLTEPIDLVARGLTTVEMLGEATAALAAPSTLATAIGWGVSDRNSSLLQQVHVPVVTEDVCATAYPDATRFETQICAGAVEGGLDTCQGDSGGPMLVRDPDRQVWLHAGITSWGEGCGLPGYPGVYARTSALSEWVKQTAKEPVVATHVRIDSGTFITTVDFPMYSTTREQAGPIAPRWQATGTTLPATVAANTQLAVRWSILSDDTALTGFSCRFEPDLLDTGLGQNVACGVGATQLALQGFPDGVFVTELVVTRLGAAFRRRADIVSGTPARVDVDGALAASDPIDPDYKFGTYYIDYYEVTGLSATRAFAVEASTNAFWPFLVIYDLDQRDFVQGGGALGFGELQADGSARIVVLPEPGRRYLVGVSSFEPKAVGGYTVSLINDGTLVPR